VSIKGIVFITLAVVFVGSVGARAFMTGESPDKGTIADVMTTSGDGAESNSFLPGITIGENETETEETEGKETGALAEALPFLTEGSFFAMIGFALGYASRKVVKLLLILLAGFFLLVQGLSYADVVQVDWQKLIDLLNGWILNLKENDTIGEVLKDKIPTAGALTAGYFLGFRKG